MASTQKRVSTNMLLNTSLYNLDLWLNNKGFFGKDLKQLKSGLCVGSILCCDMGATEISRSCVGGSDNNSGYRPYRNCIT